MLYRPAIITRRRALLTGGAALATYAGLGHGSALASGPTLIGYGAGQAAAGGGGGNPASTAAFDATGANFLVQMACITGSASGATISDNYGNTYTYVGYWTGASNAIIALNYVANPTVGPGFVATASGVAGNYPVLGVAAFGGISASPYDTSGGSYTTSAATLATPNITPAQNGSLIIGAVSDLFTGSISNSLGGATQLFDLPLLGGQAYGLSMWYYVQPTAASISTDVHA